MRKPINLLTLTKVVWFGSVLGRTRLPWGKKDERMGWSGYTPVGWSSQGCGTRIAKLHKKEIYAE
jgi:hypothetical protein